MRPSPPPLAEVIRVEAHHLPVLASTAPSSSSRRRDPLPAALLSATARRREECIGWIPSPFDLHIHHPPIGSAFPGSSLIAEQYGL
uniref:Uncharacterized protein n=1 Tax=Arundo donax TaxID=35708 RepID=A0A0A8YL37_ARUDO